MSSAFKSALRLTFLFFIGVLVLYFAFRGQDLLKIWDEIRLANPLWVAVSLAAITFANILRALRWQMLYFSIGYRRVGFLGTLTAIYVGYLANLALPKFGEIVRCKAIERQSNVPLFLSIGTVITERLFDVILLFISGVAMLIFQHLLVLEFLRENLYEGIISKIQSREFFWLVVAVLFIMALLIVVILKILRGRFKTKLIRIYYLLKKGLSSYQTLDRKLTFIGYSISIWLLYLTSIFAAFFCLDSTANLGLDAAFTALVFSGLAMAAPVQGGIGVFHWMMAKCLLLYGVAFSDGLAYATIIYAVQLLPTIIFGSIGSYLIFKGSKELNELKGIP